MKRTILLILATILLCTLASGCNTTNQSNANNTRPTITVDYPNLVDFEDDVNNGANMQGKTVTFTVTQMIPNSAFGYNIQVGQHLNFCSSEHPGVQIGDKITVRVTSITSVLGSYIIYYNIVDHLS